MYLYTIGYSGKSEAEFYEILRTHKVSRIIDVRRFKTSKYVPFANGENLSRKCKDKYVAIPDVAPEKSLLLQWQNGDIAWSYYERTYLEFLQLISAQNFFTEEILDNACLLCMEASPSQCHRKLLAQYLANYFPSLKIEHL